MKKFLALFALNISVSCLVFGMNFQYEPYVQEDEGDTSSSLGVQGTDSDSQEDISQRYLLPSARLSRFKQWILKEGCEEREDDEPNVRQAKADLKAILPLRAFNYARDIKLFIDQIDYYIELEKPTAQVEEGLQDMKKNWQKEELWVAEADYHELAARLEKNYAKLRQALREASLLRELKKS